MDLVTIVDQKLNKIQGQFFSDVGVTTHNSQSTSKSSLSSLKKL